MKRIAVLFAKENGDLFRMIESIPHSVIMRPFGRGAAFRTFLDLQTGKKVRLEIDSFDFVFFCEMEEPDGDEIETAEQPNDEVAPNLGRDDTDRPAESMWITVNTKSDELSYRNVPFTTTPEADRQVRRRRSGDSKPQV